MIVLLVVENVCSGACASFLVVHVLLCAMFLCYVSVLYFLCCFLCYVFCATFLCYVFCAMFVCYVCVLCFFTLYMFCAMFRLTQFIFTEV